MKRLLAVMLIGCSGSPTVDAGTAGGGSAGGSAGGSGGVALKSVHLNAAGQPVTTAITGCGPDDWTTDFVAADGGFNTTHLAIAVDAMDDRQRHRRAHRRSDLHAAVRAVSRYALGFT